MVEYVIFKYLNEEHVQQIPLFVIFTSLNMWIWLHPMNGSAFLVLFLIRDESRHPMNGLDSENGAHRNPKMAIFWVSNFSQISQNLWWINSRNLKPPKPPGSVIFHKYLKICDESTAEIWNPTPNTPLPTHPHPAFSAFWRGWMVRILIQGP